MGGTRLIEGLNHLRLRARILIFFEHDLREIPQISPRSEAVDFAPARPEDVSLIQNYVDGVNSQSMMLHDIAAGKRLFLVRVKGRVAWLAWVQTGEMLNVALDQPVRLAPEVADIYGMVTVPEFRNQGLARYGMARLLRHLKSEGVHRVTLQVLSHNRPSLAVMRALGCRQTARLFYLRLIKPRLYCFHFNSGGVGCRVFWRKRPFPWFDAAYQRPASGLRA